MVLYHANGRVVEAHEDYLEQQAQKEANDVTKLYIDQIDVYNQRAVSPVNDDVQIIIDAQLFKTLYCERQNGWTSDWEYLKEFKLDKEHTITIRVDRDTLKTCSTLAQEHFTYNPKDMKLHLPVCYPRQHHANRDRESIEDFGRYFGPQNVCVEGKRLAYQTDDQMAFIRPEEIEKYIVPWLEKVQEQLENAKAPRSEAPGGSEAHEGSEVHAGKMTTPPKRTKLARYLVRPSGPIAMGIPGAFVDKIHLYNAMLQLGLPKVVQLPLIDALVLQMYQTKLKACHLDTLEHTIGRFYSRGVAVLDPVLNHLIGTYSFRSLEVRKKPEPPEESDTESPEPIDDAGEGPVEETPEEASTELAVGQATDEERADGISEDVIPDEDFDFKAVRRGYLHFIDLPAHRTVYPLDTYLLPPELPVIGHSIRHWSSVRQNQSTAAAHTGFPLNIGKYKKFIRHNSTSAIDVNDRFKEETNRLIGQEYYQEHGPGEVN